MITRTRPGRPLVLAGVAVLAVVVLVLSAALHRGGGSHGIVGTVQLRQTRDQPGACAGTGSLAAVHEGAPVVITDNQGVEIARTALGPGSTGATFGADTVLSCSFSFRARHVPDEDIVRIAVADRAAIPFTHWQLNRSQWHAVLTVGS